MSQERRLGGFFETAGTVLLSVSLLVGGGVGAIGSALKARHMNLSRVNEHGVRVWKNAADSFIAPFQITALWVLAGFFAFAAIVGFLQLTGRTESSAPPVVQQNSTPRSDAVARIEPTPNLPAETTAATGSVNELGGVSALILDQSDKRLLTSSDIAALSVQQLRLARNEIFARRGRVFNDPDLQAHFEQFDWYRPTSAEVTLSQIEAANVQFLRDAEERALAGSAQRTQEEIATLQREARAESVVVDVYGLLVRRATAEELAGLGIRRTHGLFIVGISNESLWQGSRPDQSPPEVGDVILSGIGGGAWNDPVDFRNYATRSYRVCVDARKAAAPRSVTAFCRG